MRAKVTSLYGRRRVHSDPKCRNRNWYRCARCQKRTCADCQGTTDRPNLCDWCWSNAEDLREALEGLYELALETGVSFAEDDMRIAREVLGL